MKVVASILLGFAVCGSAAADVCTIANAVNIIPRDKLIEPYAFRDKNVHAEQTEKMSRFPSLSSKSVDLVSIAKHVDDDFAELSVVHNAKSQGAKVAIDFPEEVVLPVSGSFISKTNRLVRENLHTAAMAYQSIGRGQPLSVRQAEVNKSLAGKMPRTPDHFVCFHNGRKEGAEYAVPYFEFADSVNYKISINMLSALLSGQGYVSHLY